MLVMFGVTDNQARFLQESNDWVGAVVFHMGPLVTLVGENA